MRNTFTIFHPPAGGPFSITLRSGIIASKRKAEDGKIKVVERGMTLVELVLYMAILSTFLVVLTGMFVTLMDIKLRSDATSSVELDTRFITARLQYDIERADSITTPAVLGSQSDTLGFVVDGTSYTYSVQQGDVILNDGTGTYALNSSGSEVRAVRFRRLGNSTAGRNTIQINLTVVGVATASSGIETKSIQTTVGTQ